MSALVVLEAVVASGTSLDGLVASLEARGRRRDYTRHPDLGGRPSPGSTLDGAGSGWTVERGCGAWTSRPRPSREVNLLHTEALALVRLTKDPA